MNVGTVMDGLAAALAALGDLRVLAYPPDSVTPPAAIVSYPDPFTFDVAMGRGADRGTFPVHVVVGRVSDRAARDALTPYMAGAGARSVKQAIETDPTLGGAADTARVVSVAGIDLEVGGVRYVAATFTIDVVG